MKEKPTASTFEKGRDETRPQAELHGIAVEQSFTSFFLKKCKSIIIQPLRKIYNKKLI
jgi:hypothetical protein